MALTKISGDFIQDGSITQGHLHSSHGITTSDIGEGSNLYFTTARVDSRIGDLSTSDLSEGTNLYYTDARADARITLQVGSNLDLSSKSTSDLSEGTNLYYTQARFNTAFTAKSTSDLSEGTNLYYTDARADARIAAASTSDLSEGTNLYYTDARADARITAADTDSLSEGSTNLYYTDARADARVALIVDSAPGTLDTLNELAAALGDDANFSTTITNSIALKAPLASPSFTTGVDITGTLDVTGKTTFGDDITISDSTPILDFEDTDNTGNNWRMEARGSFGGFFFQSFDNNFQNGSTVLFTKYSNGYIGLGGNTNPQAQLDITGGLITSGNATFAGTITASNFSGSSSGTNTGDQTLPTLSSLGGASNVYLTNTGGAKLEIQNSVDGGSANGIYMWSSSDTNWGIYMGQAGTSKSLSDGVAASGIDGRTEHAIRFRAADSTAQIGFLWENNNEEALMQLVTDTGKLFTRGAIYPSNQTTAYVDSTRIGNWQTAYGWGDHGAAGYLTSLPSHNHDDRYYTESEMQTFFNRGYINNHSATNAAAGWYTIATNTGDRALGEFQIWDTASGDHQSVLFSASHHFGVDSSNDITVLANSRYSGTNFRYIRIKEGGTYDGAVLQVYIDGGSNTVYAAIVGGNAQESGWVLKDWIADGTDPGDVSSYNSMTERTKVDLDLTINGGIMTTGPIYSGGQTAQYRVLNTSDEGSGNGLDADTLDGQHASAFQAAGSYLTSFDITTQTDPKYLRSNTGDAATQRIQFSANSTNNWDTIATATGSLGSIEIYNDGSGNDAFMCFHTGGDFALYFGLDGGTNKLSVGGWSMGAASYEIYHAGNKPSLATLGYTGATNANYITNNNQLTNGAGYLTSTIGGTKLGFVSGSGGTTFGASHYSMGVDIANGGWSNPNYSDLIIGYHTGIRIGAAYSGTRFYANSPTTDTNNTGHGNGGEALIFTVGGAAGANDTKVEGIGYAGESFRSPLFYDNNNTTYVFHGDGTSVLNQAIISGATAGWSLQLGANNATRVQSDAARSSLVINADYYPHLYINATAGTSNTNHGAVMSMTGNISGGYRRWSMGWANWNPTVFTMGSYDSTANPHYGCGGGMGVTTWGSKFWFNTSGSGQAYSDWRAPIFYDSNNTGYYVDPASTSNTVNMYAVTQMRAPIYYSITNTAYYTRPHTSSYINSLHTAGNIQAGSSGTGNIYIGGTSGNYFRFHTNNSHTYFDANVGDIHWRQGASTRFIFYMTSANMTINGSLTQNSDERVKENIVEIPNAIDKVKAMKGVYYNRTDFNTDVTKIGVLAQEVEAVLPELIVEAPDSGLKSVAYGELTAVLINAVKEQQTIIDDLKSRLETLENN
jgi:hypothetical protein